MHRVRGLVSAISAGIITIGLSMGSATAVPATLSGGFTSFTGKASGAAARGASPLRASRRAALANIRRSSMASMWWPQAARLPCLGPSCPFLGRRLLRFRQR